MASYNTDLVPTRQRIPERQAEAIAKYEADRLMAAWGLPNVKKIVAALGQVLKAESKRRKEMED
jgi:hypothetical protein